MVAELCKNKKKTILIHIGAFDIHNIMNPTDIFFTKLEIQKSNRNGKYKSQTSKQKKNLK